MAGKFKPVRGLDTIIAQQFGRPKLERALDMLEDEARRRAPVCRVWITMRDERVRGTHVETDGQVIPDNLRFKLPKWPTAKVYDLGRHPRDPNLPKHQEINCRCDDPVLTYPLKDSIHRTDVTGAGRRVSGSVETRFPRAAESEFGTSGDDAAHYMTGALREVATRLRAGHSR